MPAENGKNERNELVEDAIASVIEGLEPRAKLAQAVDDVLAQAAEWTQLPADISDSDFLSLLVGYNQRAEVVHMLPSSLLGSVESKIANMEKNDPSRYYALDSKLKRKLSSPPLRTGELYIETYMAPPADEEGDEYSLVAVPVVMYEDYSLAMPQKLDHGLAVGLYVMPDKDANLHGKFNINAQYTPAGRDIEPFVMPYKPAAEGEKNLHIVGHIDHPEGGVPAHFYHVRPFAI